MGLVQHHTGRLVNEPVDLRQLPSAARPCRAEATSAEPGGGRASGAALIEVQLNSAADQVSQSSRRRMWQ
jgi:hypothetical protein